MLRPVVLVAFSILVCSASAHAAACLGDPGHPKVPFIDANCDGCFDVADGDDASLSQADLEQQPFNIPACFVVPKGAHVTAPKIDWRTGTPDGDMTILGDVTSVSGRDDDGISLSAGEALTIGGSIRTSLVRTRSDETPDLDAVLRAALGVTVLPGTRISANGAVELAVTDGGELVIGDGVKLSATKGHVGIQAATRDVFGPWALPAGRVQIGAGTKIKARQGVLVWASRELDIGNGVSMVGKVWNDDAPSISLRAGYALSPLDTDLGGNLIVGSRAIVKAPRSLALEANGVVQVNHRATLQAKDFTLSLFGEYAVVLNSVKATAFRFDATSPSGSLWLSGRLISKPDGAPATISAPSGTCGLNGFEGLETMTVTYDCAAIIH